MEKGLEGTEQSLKQREIRLKDELEKVQEKGSEVGYEKKEFES